MTGDETGMLDVGKHCRYCRQIDFLPFHCVFCNGDFCSEHRTRDSHYCKEGKEQQTSTKAKVYQHSKDVSNGSLKDGDRGAYFKSLLPQKGSERVKQRQTPLSTSPHNSIREMLKRQKNNKALEMLKRMFEKYSSRRDLKMNMSTSRKVMPLAKMKRTAKGDERIPLASRLYVWCYDVSDKEPVEYELYISKLWPVGKALDSLCQHMNVKNINLSVKVTSDEKVFLYKRGKGSEWILLDPTSRTGSVVDEGDALYVVRGSDLATMGQGR